MIATYSRKGAQAMAATFLRILLVSGVATGPLLAQSTSDAKPGDGLQVEEIVVTARLSEQRLQDVPLSITAFSAKGLQERSIIDVRDIARFTPNLGFFSGSGRGDLTALTVRGLSANTSDERYQGLSFFVDGIFQSGQLASIDLSQLERVELLLGPQSATFGRSTYAGAVNYVTRSPSLEKPEANIRAQLSAEDGGAFNRIINSRVSMPLIQDKLSIQLNGTHLFREGRATNPSVVGLSPGQPIGQEKTWAAGLVVFARPNETLSIKARFAYDRDEDTQPLVHIIEPAEWQAGGSQTITTPGGALWVGGAFPNPTLGATGGGEFNGPTGYDQMGRARNRYFGSLVVEQEIGSEMELSYRGGFFSEHYFANTDFLFRPAQNDIFFGNTTNAKLRTLQGTGSAGDGARSRGNAFPNNEKFTNHSHQIRLVKTGETVNFRLGLNYFKEWNENFGFNNRSGTNPDGQTRGTEIAENFAAFAGIDYTIAERLILSAEGRIERDIISQDECGFCQVNNVGNGIRDARTFFSPRATATYKLTPDNMIYAQFARGFKSARLNTGQLRLPTAEPERLDNFEIGTKNSFADGRATLNISGFYNDIRNQQAFFPVVNPLFPQPGQPAQLTGVGNFGNSRIYGFEVASAVVLVRGVTANVGIGFADHKYTQAIAPLNDINFFAPGDSVLGRTNINTPRWNLNGGLAYSGSVGNGLVLDARADVRWRSRMFVDRANLAWIAPAAQVQTRLGLSDEGGLWSAAIFTRNLFNNETAVGAGLSGSSGCFFDTRANARCLALTIPRGREVGLDVVLNF